MNIEKIYFSDLSLWLLKSDCLLKTQGGSISWSRLQDISEKIIISLVNISHSNFFKCGIAISSQCLSCDDLIAIIKEYQTALLEYDLTNSKDKLKNIREIIAAVIET